jgi:hypothetical protein
MKSYLIVALLLGTLVAPGPDRVVVFQDVANALFSWAR